MDSSLDNTIQGWRLETQFVVNGDRHHQLDSCAECWRPVQHLGNGTFGDVYQEQCLSGPAKNNVRAVKHISKRQFNFGKASQCELQAIITFSDRSVLEVRPSLSAKTGGD